MATLPVDVKQILEDAGISYDLPELLRKGGKKTKKKKRKVRAPSPDPACFWPEAPDDYIRPDCADYLYNIWPKTTRGVVNCVGPAGSGKTTTAYALFEHHNWLMLKHECKKDETASSLLGQTAIKFTAGKGGMTGGDFLRDGPILTCARINQQLKDSGSKTICGLYFNECNKWMPSNSDVLNALGDDTHSFYVPSTGERIVWEQPRILMDMNAGYAGTQEMNEALKDRFHTCFFDYLSVEEETQIVLNRTKVTEQLATRMCDALKALREATSGRIKGTPKMRFDPSLRLVLDAAECIEHGMDPDRAWQEALYGRVGYDPRFTQYRKTLAEVSRCAGFNVEDV